MRKLFGRRRKYLTPPPGMQPGVAARLRREKKARKRKTLAFGLVVGVLVLVVVIYETRQDMAKQNELRIERASEAVARLSQYYDARPIAGGVVVTGVDVAGPTRIEVSIEFPPGDGNGAGASPESREHRAAAACPTEAAIWEILFRDQAIWVGVSDPAGGTVAHRCQRPG